MTTAVVFNWLMFGWIYYLIAYDFLPLMILVTKKFLETNDLRYALINGLILSVATTQPTFILIYPLVSFLFMLFESRGSLKMIFRGLVLIAISLSVWFLTTLSFFTSYNNANTLSFYQGEFFLPTLSQFQHLSTLLNPIRLWGSTFNYQFETYFPQNMIVVSFLPVFLAMIAVLLKPRDRRVLFFLLCYLFAFVSYELFINLPFLVHNLPYGSLLEAPSIFLVPAALGLALLVGYSNQTISRVCAKFKNVASHRLMRKISPIIILSIIILAAIPWWTGQTSGNPISGPPTKLNLYEIPSSYTDWSKIVQADNGYFVLYVPLPNGSGNVGIMNTSYFSLPYEGVVSGIFSQVNNLPYISPSNGTSLLNQLINGNSEVGESWGSYSIKYVVVYTNVLSEYNVTDVLYRLSNQTGIVQVAKLPDVVVFQNNFAKPIVYASNQTTSIKINYQDPTTYKIQASSASPYFLVLNQIYSSGWTASVNGTKLTTHSENGDGFNTWYINYTGNMIIEIYYTPQTTYIVSLLVSIIVLISTSLYIILVTLRNIKRRTVYLR